MKRVLFVSLSQYGYLTDVYAYTKYLNKVFDIHVICYDLGLEKMTTKGVTVKYVKVKKNTWFFHFKVFRFLWLYKEIISYFSKHSFHIIFINYFKFCFFLRFFTFQKCILDFRTGNLCLNPARQKFWNALMRFESLFFKNIAVITESLSKVLKLSLKKVHILPLGAEIIDATEKTFSSLNLIYIGTFDKRNIENTIKGLKIFHSKYSGAIKISYDIIGYSSCSLERKLADEIKENGLEDVIKLHGRIPYNRLADYIKKCNIGVAYVPMIHYYQCQPLTKLFEYLFSGMPAIATNTYENSRIINDKNGVLVNEDSESFYIGLEIIYKRLSKYKSGEIRDSVKEYSWKEISENNLKEYLQLIIEN